VAGELPKMSQAVDKSSFGPIAASQAGTIFPSFGQSRGSHLVTTTSVSLSPKPPDLAWQLPEPHLVKTWYARKDRLSFENKRNSPERQNSLPLSSFSSLDIDGLEQLGQKRNQVRVNCRI
jgi:hypothetical protein